MPSIVTLFNVTPERVMRKIGGANKYYKIRMGG